jgi:hypothetical protein
VFGVDDDLCVLEWEINLTVIEDNRSRPLRYPGKQIANCWPPCINVFVKQGFKIYWNPC